VQKGGFAPGTVTVVPDDDKPASVTLARTARRGASLAGKIRNAVPLDPFAP
jgi:hypothetical protein